MANRTTNYALTFAVLGTAALAFALLQSLIIPAIPQLEHTLHTSESGASWLLTAYLLSAAIATPILGRVGDMLGKEKIIVAVLLALTVGSLLSALATSLPVMLVGRVIQGTGGAIFPLAFGIIRDEFPAERVAGAIGVMSAILGAGAGAGIVLAGPILVHLNYHWLFWIPMIMSAIATVATFLFVSESPVRAPGRINWLGATLMSAWLVTGLLGIGIALGFASMANLIIEAVPAEQTGVATGMNTNIRNIGAALGSGIATSLVVSGLMPGGLPKEHGYVLAFAVSGLALVVAALAALTIPKRTGPSIVEREPHPALTAEAEVVVGAIAFGPEDLA